MSLVTKASGLGLFLVIGLGALFLGHTGAAPVLPVARDATAQDIERLERKVAHLARAQGALAAGIAAVDDRPLAEPAMAEKSAAKGEESVAGVRTAGERDRAREEALAQRVALLDARLLSERRDRSWASDAEARLDGILRGAVGVSAANASCAASMCKIDLALEPSSNGQPDFSKIPNLIPWPTDGVFTVKPEAGGFSAVFYVAREGGSLVRSEADSDS